jgi:hypothetical protein
MKEWPHLVAREDVGHHELLKLPGVPIQVPALCRKSVGELSMSALQSSARHCRTSKYPLSALWHRDRGNGCLCDRTTKYSLDSNDRGSNDPGSWTCSCAHSAVDAAALCDQERAMVALKHPRL